MARSDRPRTIVLTFDNLGEASELERGTWPADRPTGAHPSVTVALPRLLDELDALELRATFFVEAINCELNPGAVTTIAERGHELGIHGWRHEPWGEVDGAREPELLERSAAAFRSLGLEAQAFRPPGGSLHANSPRLLREAGCRWVSALGEDFRTDPDGFGWIPFRWELVDAYHLMDLFADLRAEHGDPAEALSAEATRERMDGALASGPAVQTLITHAFLMLDDAWWAQVRGLLRSLADRRENGGLEVVTGGELTERMANATAATE